jgi:hypothetical protein
MKLAALLGAVLGAAGVGYDRLFDVDFFRGEDYAALAVWIALSLAFAGWMAHGRRLKEIALFSAMSLLAMVASFIFAGRSAGLHGVGQIYFFGSFLLVQGALLSISTMLRLVRLPSPPRPRP